MAEKINRVMVYVDGFNLYFGMVESGLHHCKWLDINKLITSCLTPNQEAVAIKYFTSRVSNNPQSKKDKPFTWRL